MPWPTPADAHGIRAGLARLVSARRSLPHLHAAVPTEVWDPRDPGVLLVVRRHPSGPLLGAYNVTGEQRAVPREGFAWLGLDPTTVVDHLGDAPPQASEAGLTLPPYAALWLTAPRDTAG